MHILIATSEAVPFAKTGGLADVSSGLANALAAKGHKVTLMMPCYRRLIEERKRSRVVGQVTVKLGKFPVSADVLQTNLPDTKVEVLFVDRPEFFDRANLYTEDGKDFDDNAERFLFFSRAVAEYAEQEIKPDVIHVNDWQTALIPALVSNDLATERVTKRAATVLTIHNMAFHGRFPSEKMGLTGLPWELFNWKQFEYYDELNLLKGGIACADMVTTVSPTYATEIRGEEYGYGLDQTLLERGDSLVGILNGVDTKIWNPATDQLIETNYDGDTFAVGKLACKRALQKELGLPVRDEAMVFGMVSRLTDQKGLDLITKQADAILEADVQFAFLGTGDPAHEKKLNELQAAYPEKVSATIGFDEGLAHRIEAGSDAYLMPSSFEPCGLNQMYSLIYGTVPIVHAVGGLADSIVDATDETLENSTATGFQFFEYDADLFLETVWRAVGMFQHNRETWNDVMVNGMTRDSSWNASAAEYIEVYERAIEAAKA